MQEKNNSVSLLEHLPNEIFAEIFSYLNGVDAFVTFSSLNNRFRCLIDDYCLFFDFKSISKRKFDFIFENHETNHWLSLQLVDDETTSGQIEYFLEKYSSQKSFSRLKSFSLWNITNLDRNILLQFSFLKNLHSLSIGPVPAKDEIFGICLPNLKKLVISEYRYHIDWINTFPQLEILEYIHPCLYYLDTSLSTLPLTLKRLKVILLKHDDSLLLLPSLKGLSQLNTLEIYQEPMNTFPPSGKIWEEFIQTSLPLLKHLKFYFRFYYELDNSDQLNDILTSFSSSFYVFEKNWFIRCDLGKKSRHNKTYAILYSLPFAFDQLTIVTKCVKESFSTLSNCDSKRNSYSNVKTLKFQKSLSFDESFNQTNIINLYINHYFHFNQWSHVFINVRSLEFGSNIKIWSKIFDHLLNNTPNLSSLIIEKDLLRGVTNNWMNIRICHILSKQIRSLKLHFKHSRIDYNELQKMIPIFNKNCEHLSIDFLMKTKSIAFIFQHMSHLQSLHVKIDSKYSDPVSNLWFDLEQKQKVFTRFNSSMIHRARRLYFWLGKYF